MNILDSFFGAGAFQEDAAPAPYVAPLERRDYAAAVPLLKAAVAGGKHTESAASRIPVIGQAVLGFVLPWLLALVAMPLEMLVQSGRHMATMIVAFVLGFADTSAFSRAFKRWTGMSPRDWAKRRSRTG